MKCPSQAQNREQVAMALTPPVVRSIHLHRQRLLAEGTLAMPWHHGRFTVTAAKIFDSDKSSCALQ